MEAPKYIVCGTRMIDAAESRRERTPALVYEPHALSLNQMPDQPRQKPPPRERHGPED